MQSYEEEASELLWKYITELRRVEDTDAVNFIARTPVDPADLAALMPLADALHENLHTDMSVSSGQIAGRAALMEAIRADEIRASRSPKAPAGTRWRLPFVHWNRQWALTLLLLMLSAVAVYAWRGVWLASRNNCSPTGTPPPPAPMKILVKPAKPAAAPEPLKPCIE
jgi:hypothetical protein